MTTLPGHTLAPGFDDPLELIQACHNRIQAQCDMLRKLRQHLSAHGCDRDAQEAARAILRYFDIAGQHHHQDEEQDLFPQLLDMHDQAANSLVQRLLGEHTIMDTVWQRLRPQLFAIAQENAMTLDVNTTDDFIHAYEEHIALENTQLLPLAARLLTLTQLETIGRSMAARRGAVYRPNDPQTSGNNQ